MTDDDHAVRLRERVLFRHKGWCGGSNDGCTHWEADAAAYDQAIRYHEAKARVEALAPFRDAGVGAFHEWEAWSDELAAIIKEIEAT